MHLQQQLTEIERKLWTNDPVFYASALRDDAVLIFPETGAITRDAAVAAIRVENAEGRRWEEVHFHDERLLELRDGVVAILYRVVARWARETRVTTALAASTYVEGHGGWMLALHQQTPIASDR